MDKYTPKELFAAYQTLLFEKGSAPTSAIAMIQSDKILRSLAAQYANDPKLYNYFMDAANNIKKIEGEPFKFQ